MEATHRLLLCGATKKLQFGSFQQTLLAVLGGIIIAKLDRKLTH